mmetsp:Transcript_18426/g.59954  ORF Transcript_18426/g.59954 Transcript_18426/m.59954 type:complete len:119 (-) Transcript_18426:867-1223(-)
MFSRLFPSPPLFYSPLRSGDVIGAVSGTAIGQVASGPFTCASGATVSMVMGNVFQVGGITCTDANGEFATNTEFFCTFDAHQELVRCVNTYVTILSFCTILISAERCYKVCVLFEKRQ